MDKIEHKCSGECYDLRLNRCWSFTPYGLVMLIPRNIEPEPDYIELMEYAGMA